MRKLRLAALAAALVLTLGVTTAAACGGHHGWTGADCWIRSGVCYVDADGDGVCDHCGTDLGRWSGHGCRGGRCR